MSLPDLFTNLPPRETSGSTVPDRFEYQKDWSLCLLLQLHLNDSDYLVVLDMHEDVVVFDSPSSPQKVKFYQIKTINSKSQKSWTRTALLKQHEGKKALKNSILGKLFSNKLKFETNPEKLAVVSNAPFSLRLTSGKRASITDRLITFMDLHASERSAIEEALKKELSLPAVPVLKDLLFLEVSDLHIDKHSEHTRGKLVDFLELCAPKCATPVGTIYRVLIDHVRVKNDSTVKTKTFSELTNLKGISRREFQKILDRLGAKDDLNNTWNKVEVSLENRLPINRRNSLRIALRQVVADRMSGLRTEASKLYDLVSEITIREASASDTVSLYDFAEHVLQKSKQAGFDDMRFSDDYVRVISMLSFYETGII